MFGDAMIVATAGHVDHGKTELIRALTGINTDRLPEERLRGLSIDLGFAYQTLGDSTTLGFVDVPGHEKFIRNMLSGVGGIDMGLLVVAADDGLMPQTLEHFSILDLLGIKRMIVAITKIDRVDWGRVLEVNKSVETLLEDSGFSDNAVFPVCAPANEGIGELQAALHQRAKSLTERKSNGYFRMAIDRAFTVQGAGLVVTGMVFSGIAGIEDQLVVSSNGATVRVRGIRSLNEVSDQAKVGNRCAINVTGRGVSEESVKRGDWLMHQKLYAPTRRLDVDLRVLASEPTPLKHWTPTHLHIGAAHMAARVAVLEGGSIPKGGRGFAQLVLEKDAFIVHGDRLVLRDQSAQRTIAGGRVLDPFSPKRGRARPARLDTLRAMTPVNVGDVLDGLTKISENGVVLPTFAVAHNLQESEVNELVENLSLLKVGRYPKETIFDAVLWDALLSRVELGLSKFHQVKPSELGPNFRDLEFTLKPHVEFTVLESAVAALIGAKALVRSGSRFHLPSHTISVSPDDRKLWARVSAKFSPENGSPLSLHQAAEEIGVDKKTLELSLKNAVKIGEMVQVSKNRYVPVGYVTNLGLAAEDLAERSGRGLFTVGDYRDQTQIGRNFAIDLLEYFDRIAFTERLGNNRRIKRPAKSVFSIENGDE